MVRGGARIKKKIKMGDQALLQAIWEAHGGPAAVAQKISAFSGEPIHLQAPINWRTRGIVPRRYIKIVCQALGIEPTGLHYKFLFDLDVDIPPWETVVRSYGLDEEVVKAILFLRPPHKVKSK